MYNRQNSLPVLQPGEAGYLLAACQAFVETPIRIQANGILSYYLTENVARCWIKSGEKELPVNSLGKRKADGVCIGFSFQDNLA